MRRIAAALCLALLAAALAAPPGAPAARAAFPLPICQAPRYAGIRHCVHSAGQVVVHLLLVDLTNPAVSLRLALPARETPAGLAECDSTVHCGEGYYPFESVPQMLARQAASGAVAGINTDYFGLSYQPDHGAEGIAVRDGARLDGEAASGLVGRTHLAISRSNRARLLWVGPRGAPLDLAGRDYNVAGGGPQIVARGRPLGNQACLSERLGVAVCTRLYHSAAGLRDGGRSLVLATARNMDSAALAAFLVDEYRVSEALKFDGGGSAQLAWLDAAGRPAGFDASDTTDGGFRRVAEGLLVYSQPLFMPPAGEFPGAVVDDAAVVFRQAGHVAEWHDAVGGQAVGGAFRWTRNNTWSASEAGEWNLQPPGPGLYALYAFIPAGRAATRAARYEVLSREGRALVEVDQWAMQGRWALLGSFDLAGDGTDLVRLTNATGEAYGSRLVAYDAVGLLDYNSAAALGSLAED